MTLTDDISRCQGVQIDGEWREGCEDCLRRTSPLRNRPGIPHIQPPAIIVFECEYRLEPSA